MVYYRSSEMRNYGEFLRAESRVVVEARKKVMHLTDSRRTKTYELFARSLDLKKGRVYFPTTHGALDCFTFDYNNWRHYNLETLINAIEIGLKTDLWCLEQDEHFAVSSESELNNFAPTTQYAVTRLNYLSVIAPKEKVFQELYNLMFDCRVQCLAEQKKASINYKNIKKYEKGVEKLIIYLKELRVMWYFQMLPFNVRK